jgi:cytochrome oxidase Cu insertion factor (SCO1/SenC/PrrC family)
MWRVLATLGIVALLALDLALPAVPGMQRGREAVARSEVPGAAGRVGERLPDFTLPDLDGVPVTLSDLRGHRVLLTFERSVDW